MAVIKPTRMELLKTRKRLKLAQKGHKLLKEKRDVLVMEFFNILKDIKQFRANIAGKLNTAQASLGNSQAIDGEANIQRIATTLSKDVDIEFSNKSLMGVEFPEIKNISVDHIWPGYFDMSVEFDNSVVQYRELFNDILRLSEKQLMLRKLAEEIKKTKRRVNALEFFIIPNLEALKKMVTFKLEELERENFSRLKIIKKAS